MPGSTGSRKNTRKSSTSKSSTSRRPKEGIRLEVGIELELLDEIRARADAEDRSVASLVRLAVRRYLDAGGEESAS